MGATLEVYNKARVHTLMADSSNTNVTICAWPGSQALQTQPRGATVNTGRAMRDGAVCFLSKASEPSALILCVEEALSAGDATH